MTPSDRQADLWGRAASDWAELQESHHGPLFEAMLDTVDLGTGDRFLDAGCGSGAASLLAGKRGAIVVALDVAPEMVRIARNRFPSGEFHVGDLGMMPFLDGVFDVVFAANSVQFADSPTKALSELRRVARADARVVVSLFAQPDLVDFAVAFDALAHLLPPDQTGRGAFALSQGKDLEQLMEQCGLVPYSSIEVPCRFAFPDGATFWRALRSSGPTQSALDLIQDPKTAREAVVKAAERFSDDEGAIEMTNTFKVVSAVLD